MGLFEMDGGCSRDPYYDIGSPLFDRIVLHLDPTYYGVGLFTIEARDNSSAHVYVQSATLNGVPLAEPRLRHADLVKGGTLVLQMGPEPKQSTP
jgi:putative alpha-1,2-mannosidase